MNRPWREFVENWKRGLTPEQREQYEAEKARVKAEYDRLHGDDSDESGEATA